jgi:hypothetical protein
MDERTDEAKYLEARHWLPDLLNNGSWFDPAAPPDGGSVSLAYAAATQRARDAAELRNVVGAAIANAAARASSGNEWLGDDDQAKARRRVAHAATLAEEEYRSRFGAKADGVVKKGEVGE